MPFKSTKLSEIHQNTIRFGRKSALFPIFFFFLEKNGIFFGYLKKTSYLCNRKNGTRVFCLQQRYWGMV